MAHRVLQELEHDSSSSSYHPLFQVASEDHHLATSAVISLLERDEFPIPFECGLEDCPNQELEAREVPRRDLDVKVSRVFRGTVLFKDTIDAEKKQRHDELMLNFLRNIRTREINELLAGAHPRNQEVIDSLQPQVEEANGDNLVTLYQKGIISSFNLNYTNGTLIITRNVDGQYCHEIEITLSDFSEEWQDGDIQGVTHKQWTELKKAFYDERGTKVPHYSTYRRGGMGPYDGLNTFEFRPDFLIKHSDKRLFPREESRDKKHRRVCSGVREVGQNLFGDANEQKIQIAQTKRELIERISQATLTTFRREIQRLIREMQELDAQIQEAGHGRAQLVRRKSALASRKNQISKMLQECETIKFLELEMALLLAHEEPTSDEQFEYFKRVYRHLKAFYKKHSKFTEKEKLHILQIISLSSTKWRSAVSRIFEEKLRQSNFYQDPIWETALLGIMEQARNFEKIPELLERRLLMIFIEKGFSQEDSAVFIQNIIRHYNRSFVPAREEEAQLVRSPRRRRHQARSSQIRQRNEAQRGRSVEMPVVRDPSRQQRPQALPQANAFEEVVTSSELDSE